MSPYRTLLSRASTFFVIGLVASACSLTSAPQEVTAAPRYDVTVTHVSATPAEPVAGEPVVFAARVTNLGTGPTPPHTTWRVAFEVDGVITNWESVTASLGPGSGVTVAATSGPGGATSWTATSGEHVVKATADDQDRLTKELNETNNALTITLDVGTTPPAPTTTTPPASVECSATATTRIGPTRGGSVGFANGYRYAQLTTTERDQYMDAFAATGAKWFRMNLEAWDLAEAHDVVARAKARGVCIIGNLNGNATGTTWDDPPDHQAWAAAAADLVSSLKADVNVWEVWNEPNLRKFWPTTAESYADLLHRTYLAIKAVDGDAVVLGAGLSPAGGASDPDNAVNFWRRVYTWNQHEGRVGSAELFDGLAHHPYLFPEDPLAPAYAASDANAFYQTYLIHQLMADPDYGGPTNDGAKRIWATEAGFPTDCSLQECVSLSDAAARIPATLDVWMNDWGSFTGPFLFYQLQEQPGQTDREHYFGFIRGDWTPKDPMYSALTSYTARSD